MSILLRTIIFSLLLPISFVSSADVIHLRKTPESPIGQYLKEVLVQAYSSLGHSVIWLDMAGTTELELVEKNRLSAALARMPLIENEFPLLIRIPFPLFHFKLLKIADKARCGECLDKNIRTISYIMGSRISTEYSNKLSPKTQKFPIKQSEKLIDMLLKKRVDAIYIMDFQLNGKLFHENDYTVEVVHEEYDYHYLSPAKASLKAPLFKALTLLESNGSLAGIRQKYAIEPQSITIK
jgi:hypothetical protein